MCPSEITLKSMPVPPLSSRSSIHARITSVAGPRAGSLAGSNPCLCTPLSTRTLPTRRTSRAKRAVSAAWLAELPPSRFAAATYSAPPRRFSPTRTVRYPTAKAASRARRFPAARPKPAAATLAAPARPPPRCRAAAARADSRAAGTFPDDFDARDAQRLGQSVYLQTPDPLTTPATRPERLPTDPFPSPLLPTSNSTPTGLTQPRHLSKESV